MFGTTNILSINYKLKIESACIHRVKSEKKKNGYTDFSKTLIFLFYFAFKKTTLNLASFWKTKTNSNKSIGKNVLYTLYCRINRRDRSSLSSVYDSSYIKTSLSIDVIVYCDQFVFAHYTDGTRYSQDPGAAHVYKNL